uniref:Uncharacterized protein n=1 Tax=Solanum lycopersicum TaxID=4081 RepID=A0A3Q7H2J0_SOLLC
MADSYALHESKLKDEGNMDEKQISGESGTRKQGPCSTYRGCDDIELIELIGFCSAQTQILDEAVMITNEVVQSWVEHWSCTYLGVVARKAFCFAAMAVGNDDFSNLSFPYELINRTFEIIRLISWLGITPDFVVIFAAMASLDLFLP